MDYELSSIFASYDGVPVLEDISLTLERGTITVLLGPSGCGKTTLLNLIAGLKLPDSGKRLGFDGCRFSYAFQDPRLLAWLDCRENIAFALSGTLGREESFRRADRFLESAGLAGYSRLRPVALSGGMRRRLSLSRAFAYPSDILLMDEAFQALDLRMKLELMDVFLGLMREDGRTVVCVTHDVEEAAYLADKAIVLSPRPARIVDAFEVGTPRSERSLGSPATMEAEARLYRLALSSS